MIERYGRRWAWQSFWYLGHPDVPSGYVVKVRNMDAPYMTGKHLGTEEPTRAEVTQGIEFCIQRMLDAEE